MEAIIRCFNPPLAEIKMSCVAFKCGCFINMQEFLHVRKEFKCLHEYLGGNAGKTNCKTSRVIFVEEPSDLDKIEYSDLEESDENSKTSTGECLVRDGGTDKENDVHSDESSSDVSV